MVNLYFFDVRTVTEDPTQWERLHDKIALKMKTHSYNKEVININWDMCLISLQYKHTFDVHFQSMHLYIIMVNAYHTLQSYDFTVGLMEVLVFSSFLFALQNISLSVLLLPAGNNFLFRESCG